MPKLSSAPITAADLSEYLEGSDDFQLELDVFHSCLREGLFSAEHGGTYEDPVTKKDRQFDIRMAVTHGCCTLRLAVECKNLRTNFPLLVSRVPRRAEEAFHQTIFSTERTFHRTLQAPFTVADTHSLPRSLYKPGDPVGKSTVQVGRTASGELLKCDSDVYEKWAQAIASAHDLISQSAHDYKQIGSIAATVVIPVLVLADDTLWTVDYSAHGELLGGPKQSDECTSFIGKSVSTAIGGVEYTLSHLHIFTKTKFDRFLDQLAVSGDLWNLIFPNNPLNGLLMEFKQRELRLP